MIDLEEETSGSYSAVVKITLLVDGREMKAAQVGPDFIIFSAPVSLAGGPATIVVTVDGRAYPRNVMIAAGQSAGERIEFRKAA